MGSPFALLAALVVMRVESALVQPPLRTLSPAVHRSALACVRMCDGEADIDGGSLARPINRYVDYIQNVSAQGLIRRFADTAPPEVQQAVRSTVVSLLGNLPEHLYETNVMSTGQNVASLMFSMQMTGYMFRNAEYRRSLLESLERSEVADGVPALERTLPPSSLGGVPPISGRIKVKLSESLETEVEAAAYMAELRAEVAQLKSELLATRKDILSSSESAGGLVAFMQGLGRDNMEALSRDVSEDVLEAMRLLIESILSSAGVGEEEFMETSGLKLRELLVWQLITGYTLRELEAKEELNQRLGDEEGDGDGGG